LAQPFAGGGGQDQPPAQDHVGRQQQPAWHLERTRREQHRERVAPAVAQSGQRDVGQHAGFVATPQRQLQVALAHAQQQPLRRQADQVAGAGRQPRGQRVAPPGQKAPQARPQRAFDAAQPGAQASRGRIGLFDHGAHRGNAPSSHFKMVNADPGIPLGPSRTPARRAASRPSPSLAWLSLLYVPLPAPTKLGSPGRGGRSRSASTGPGSTPMACSTGAAAKRASGIGRPPCTVRCAARRSNSAGVMPSTCSTSATVSNGASFAPQGRPAAAYCGSSAPPTACSRSSASRQSAIAAATASASARSAPSTCISAESAAGSAALRSNLPDSSMIRTSTTAPPNRHG